MTWWSATNSALIVSGYAIRQKGTPDGARQIVSVHIPGDFIDLEGAFLATANHNIQALTRCELALVPTEAILALVAEHPMVARAMWVDTLVDASIFREWVLNIGRRDARERVAHLLCEFSRRLEVAGLANEAGYELPMTQEQLANATGLTSVHVNRTLKSMEADRLAGAAPAAYSHSRLGAPERRCRLQGTLSPFGPGGGLTDGFQPGAAGRRESASDP